MLLGMIRPNTGTATVLQTGCAWQPGAVGQVGYLVESPHAYPELTVVENLEVAAACTPALSQRRLGRSLTPGAQPYANRRAATCHRAMPSAGPGQGPAARPAPDFIG